MRFGWQIDMFAGYSGATPTLWALAGYDGMFSRWEGTAAMRDGWVAERAHESIWEPSAELGGPDHTIWSHMISGNYCDLIKVLNWTQTDTPLTYAEVRHIRSEPRDPSRGTKVVSTVLVR